MSESLEMLKTEEGQLNAVFACFGSAAQHGQFLEAVLGDLLILYSRLSNTSLTVADIEAQESSLRKQTLGALLSKMRKHITISDDTIRP